MGMEGPKKNLRVALGVAGAMLATIGSAQTKLEELPPEARGIRPVGSEVPKTVDMGNMKKAQQEGIDAEEAMKKSRAMDKAFEKKRAEIERKMAEREEARIRQAVEDAGRPSPRLPAPIKPKIENKNENKTILGAPTYDIALFRKQQAEKELEDRKLAEAGKTNVHPSKKPQSGSSTKSKK